MMLHSSHWYKTKTKTLYLRSTNELPPKCKYQERRKSIPIPNGKIWIRMWEWGQGKMNTPQIVIYIKLQKNQTELTNFPTQESEYKSPNSFIPLLSFSTQTSLDLLWPWSIKYHEKGRGGLYVLTTDSLFTLTVPEQYLRMQRNTVNRATFCKIRFQEICWPLDTSLWHIT